MKATSTFCKLFLTLCVLLGLTGCSQKPVEKQVFAMDTYMTMTAYGKAADAALTEAIRFINDTAYDLDPEVEKSTVYAMNHAGGAPVEVPHIIQTMLATAKQVHRDTKGALDLTIYPVVKAWGFIDGKHTVPSASEMQALQSVPCFDEVAVADGSSAVTMPAGTEISFGAIAKGAVAEECAGILKAHGVESALLSLGGNVQTIGTKPDGSQWRIGVQDPNSPNSYLGILTVGETAAVTSGSYQRYFEADGKVYHHIIDPATAAPADSGLVSVTILCPGGTMADALSTAMFVLGEDAALDYRSTHNNFDMILVTANDRVIVAGDLVFEETAERYTYEYVD